MDLKNLLFQYKDITISIILSLKKMEYDNVEELLIKRQEVINKLTILNNTSDEFEKIIRDINLLELNDKAISLINNNRLDLKNKINSIAKGKIARKSYSSNFYNNVKNFSKKV